MIAKAITVAALSAMALAAIPAAAASARSRPVAWQGSYMEQLDAVITPGNEQAAGVLVLLGEANVPETITYRVTGAKARWVSEPGSEPYKGCDDCSDSVLVNVTVPDRARPGRYRVVFHVKASASGERSETFSLPLFFFVAR
jgi:hypothetical protein